MKAERHLFWQQGLFLQPQHLQLLDRSHQGLFAPYRRFLEPYFWGVGSMDILKGALGTRTFHLAGGAFLFPDGTYTSLPGNALCDARAFDEAWVEGGRPFTVYLGLRKWNDSGVNVTVLPAIDDITAVRTRYVAVSDPEDVRDLHAGGPEGRVQRMSAALKIFWETELPQLGDYHIIPIAQLERFGTEVRLREDFIPPSISLAGSEPLERLVREIRDQVTARGYQLEEHKSRRGVQTAEFGSRDMVYMLALRSINRYVPLLYHLTEAEDVHPWHAFGVLRQLAGELTSFSDRIGVLGDMEDGKRLVPPYDHRNLWGCFAAVQSLVSHLLDEITAGPDYVIRLVFDGTYYCAELKPSLFEGRNRFYLAVRTEEGPKIVLQTLENIAKLSSREYLEVLVPQALPGIGLEYLQVPPQELPRRANTIYFSIDHHDEQWTTVARGHFLALYWNSAPEDLEIELMVVGR